ncbi:hypothetical protein X975_24844, partial [Stegodyphus mimosarum]
MQSTKARIYRVDYEWLQHNLNSLPQEFFTSVQYLKPSGGDEDGNRTGFLNKRLRMNRKGASKSILVLFFIIIISFFLLSLPIFLLSFSESLKMSFSTATAILRGAK